MKRYILFAVAVLSACSGNTPNPFQPKQTCTIHGASFLLEEPGDCKYFEAVVFDAVHAISTDGIATEETLGSILAGTSVWVHKDAVFECWGSKDSVLGCEHPETGDIEIGMGGGSFLHELLHAVAIHQGVSPDDDHRHLDWGVKNAVVQSPLTVVHESDGTSYSKLPGSWWDLADAAEWNWTKIYNHLEDIPSTGVVTTPAPHD